ncbi:ABC transporter substrate-binding protein [Chelativorans sp. AA-79]|uniref:ABC transporter substrate-binding protein n=1 Tax=Chelativorans sp. AA-79 TaxID=3028735 RepID=UPI0023FA1468|nr:ABC transporter substrate-binding protein [Chelativorans sp. AA-79]WEX11274.1 ABC transporter substrate-binding protein [Chelativorans sp. AA-79]
MVDRLTERGGISRRDVLRGSAGVLVSMTAFGLGSGKAAAQEQTFKIIHPSFDMNWSPMRGGGAALRWHSLWWASPMYFNDKGEIQPYVFTSWQPNADRTVWTFKLDPKAVFSDASPITAADVKGSWEVASMPLTASQRVPLVLAGVVGYDEIATGKAKDLPGVEIVDDQTVRVTLKQPDPIFHMRIANHLVPIVKASQARGEDGNQIEDWYLPEMGVVSSGPFKLVEMNLDDGFVAWEPNENFFGPEPKLTRIELRVIEDSVTATTLLKQGEYHAHTALVTPTIVQDLGPEFSMGTEIPNGQHFYFNAKTPPFDDINVRKALILAVDRAQMMRASFPNGPHKQAEQILVGVDGVDPNWDPYPYDPEEAKRLLAASSYGGPERLPRIIFAGVIAPAEQAAAQFAVEQWRQNLGITAVELKPTLDNFSPADVHVIRDDAGSRVPDATEFLRTIIHSSSRVAREKMNGYNNPEVDRLLDEAAPLPLDDPRRNELAQQAQRVFREDYQLIPWYIEAMSRWALPNIKGMEKNLDWQVFAPWNIEIT